MYEHLLCIGKRFDGDKLLQYWSALDAQGQPSGSSFAFATPIQNAHTGEVWHFPKNAEGQYGLSGDTPIEGPLFAHHHSNRQLVNLLFLDEQTALNNLMGKLMLTGMENARKQVVDEIRENLPKWCEIPPG